MHIKYLEDRIKKDIACVEANEGYGGTEAIAAHNICSLKDELELWHLLNEFKAHENGAGAYEVAANAMRGMNTTGKNPY